MDTDKVKMAKDKAMIEVFVSFKRGIKFFLVRNYFFVKIVDIDVFFGEKNASEKY
jgi:hypothetical protein